MMSIIFRAIGLGVFSWWKLAAIGGAIVAVFVAYEAFKFKHYMRGWNAHKAAVEKRDAEAAEAARRARSRLDECRAAGLRWDQSTGECVGR